MRKVERSVLIYFSVTESFLANFYTALIFCFFFIKKKKKKNQKKK